MSAINPVQIPFWFGWSTVLFTKKILEPVNSQYNFYIIGIGIGTLMGNAVFIFGGKWMVSKISNSEQYLNWVLGSIFAITALIQFWKMMRKKKEDNLQFGVWSRRLFGVVCFCHKGPKAQSFTKFFNLIFRGLI